MAAASIHVMGAGREVRQEKYRPDAVAHNAGTGVDAPSASTGADHRSVVGYQAGGVRRHEADGTPRKLLDVTSPASAWLVSREISLRQGLPVLLPVVPWRTALNLRVTMFLRQEDFAAAVRPRPHLPSISL